MLWRQSCAHEQVACVNPHDLIRRYRCIACRSVMLCACEEEFGRAYFPKEELRLTQTEEGEIVPVTDGYLPDMCNTCRGLPDQPAPRGDRRNTSNVRRHYWREVERETVRQFAALAREQGDPDWQALRWEQPETYKAIEKSVAADVARQHKESPKYDVDDETEEQFLARLRVDVRVYEGTYVRREGKKLRILHEGKPVSPEAFVGRSLRAEGYTVHYTESEPFQALFTVLMWPALQPRNGGLLESVARALGLAGEVTWQSLPQGFGTSGWAESIAGAIDEHFGRLSQVSDQLLEAFDAWVEPSAELRELIWGHEEWQVTRARSVLSALQWPEVERILRYLGDSLWERQYGWPDLFAHKDGEVWFVKVKSHRDRLGDYQRNWIEANARELEFRFSLARILEAADDNGCGRDARAPS